TMIAGYDLSDYHVFVDVYSSSNSTRPKQQGGAGMTRAQGVWGCNSRRRR
ncbi:hypothetical protein HN873_065605, partial [Arachis hypogaea]